MEQTQSDKLFVVKVSGPNVDFIAKVADTIKANYTVILASRLKKNERDLGYHLFLTIVDMERV